MYGDIKLFSGTGCLQLAEEISALRSDPQAIERLAREELGLVRPGETVFLIREELSPDPR